MSDIAVKVRWVCAQWQHHPISYFSVKATSRSQSVNLKSILKELLLQNVLACQILNYELIIFIFNFMNKDKS